MYFGSVIKNACSSDLEIEIRTTFTKESQTVVPMKFTQNYVTIKKCRNKAILQGWPTFGSRATCGSLKDYLWLSINVPEFALNSCVMFLKIAIVLYVFQNVF